LRKKEPIIINNNHSDYCLSIDPSQKTKESSSFIFIPLFRKTELVGLFSLAVPKTDTFSAGFVEFTQNVCFILGNAIGHLLNQERRQIIEQQYRLIVNEQTELICRLNNDYSLLFRNEAFLAFFGSNGDTFLNKNFLMLLSLKDRSKYLCMLKTLTPANPVGVFEAELKNAANENRHTEWITRAEFDQQNQIQEYQLVGRDITGRIKSEAKILEKQKLIQKIFKISQNHIFLIDVLNKILFILIRLFLNCLTLIHLAKITPICLL